MKDFRDLLIDPREKIEAVLGNNIAQTYLSTGNIGEGFAILSDKRVYFKGKCLYKSGKKYYSSSQERVVDLNDVTGSGFERINPIYLLVTGIVFAVLTLIFLLTITVHAANDHSVPETGENRLGSFLFVPFLITALIFLILYTIKKRNIFKIDYAGGSIGFDLRLIPYSEAEHFNKALRTCKDNAIKASQTMFAAVTVPQQQSYQSDAANVGEQLQKYNELLAQGIITQADYDAKKKQLLGL